MFNQSRFKSISESHTCKIYPKLDNDISHIQFGLSLDNKEALFNLNLLIQRRHDLNCDIFACFLDFEKVFDRLNKSKLIQTLLSQV